MITSIRLRKLVLVSTACAITAIGAAQVLAQQGTANRFGEMRWRLIGPFRGGRALTASGVPWKPNEYLFGAVGGGVWKTENAGETWRPIFDDQPIASIGALAVAPSRPDTIYVGTGEADMRSDITFGDGVYKSTDGGKTWRNIGLRDSQQIGRVLVHPRDPNIVLVAALGHAFGPNPERGVYRTTDGGVTWKKVLGKNDDTGAIDLAFDPTNLLVVYASLWQVRRPAWSVYAPTSGPGSGLYKSVDGGITWRQITGNGFPDEKVGRIGIAVAPGEGGRRVYALVDASAGGMYRSDDAGKTWRRVSSDRRIWMRGWYFGGVTADPKDPNIVFVSNTTLYRSTDGGEHFIGLKGAPGGDDYHSLWVAPDDSRRMILASDQGAAISVDGGRTWSSWFNQPTAQFYHVTTDDRFPYMVYGSQQDSGTAAVASRSNYGQITFREWTPVGGEESGYIALSPADPQRVYGGGPLGVVLRFDWATGQSLDVSPEPKTSSGNQLRFTWTSPLVFSPQDLKALYFGAQYVLRSDDWGQSWKPISPDLTFATGASKSPDAPEEQRGVVYTIAPSPVRAGEIWAGTDNGFIQLTTDEGKTWDNVTPPGLPEWSMISLIEASRFDAGTAYAAIDRHQEDDFQPYIYRTHDAGKTWRKTADGIPANAYVHVVREDPERRGLLFAGTELGVYYSLDDGDHWQSLQLNLPVASVRDLAVHGNDLVAATHGRSFWILDDIEPLREWAEQIETQDAYLYHPAHANRIRLSENHDSPLPPETPVGENPPAGAIIDYTLKADVGEVALEIHDKEGELVRRISSEVNASGEDPAMEFPSYWIHPQRTLGKSAGAHRFVWDLRYTPPPTRSCEYSSAAPISTGSHLVPQGPLVVPGEYDVRLVVGEKIYSRKLVVELDPRVRATVSELAKQFELEQQLDAGLAKTFEIYSETENVRGQLHALREQATGKAKPKEVMDGVAQAERRTDEIEGHKADYPLLPTGFVELDRSLSSLAVLVGAADSAPTVQATAAYEAAQKRLMEQSAAWEKFKQQDLSSLNARLKAAGLASIDPGKSSKAAGEQACADCGCGGSSSSEDNF